MSPQEARQIAQLDDVAALRQMVLFQAEEIERLETQVRALEKRLAELEATTNNPAVHAAEIAHLKEMLALLRKQRYGAKSERRRTGTNASADQADKPEKDKAPGHGPRPQPDLREEARTSELPPDARACPTCGGTLEPMSGQADETRLIDVISRQVVAVVHRALKYRCRCNSAVVTAPGPTRLKPGGLYSPGFAVEVALEKYEFHLPLARVVRAFQQAGLRIDTQTLWDQLDALAEVLAPTAKAIHQTILAQPVLAADETGWPVLDNGQLKENKKYVAWCLLGADLVSYHICKGHDQAAGAEVLKGYRGVVMCDGAPVYQALAVGNEKEGRPPFTCAHCWSHVRRKFVDAEPSAKGPCQEALALIGELFQIEREAKNLPDAERLAIRQARAKPIVDALFTWAEQQQQACLPQSLLAKAIGYMSELKIGLRRFLDDPRIPLSNNECEQAQRGIVLGRKNHYGSRSVRGTEVAAIFYTLVESAKLSGVDPKAYLLAATELALQRPGAILLPADFKAKIAQG